MWVGRLFAVGDGIVSAFEGKDSLICWQVMVMHRVLVYFCRVYES